MAVGTPKYLTATNAKANSIVNVVRNAADATLNAFILRAEDLVDAYIGKRQHHADDTDTHRIFPRAQDEDDDSVVTIPPEVGRATLYIVEWLMLKGAPASADAFDGTRASESIGSSGGYSYASMTAHEEQSRLIPPLARQILDTFKPVAVEVSVRSAYED